MKVLSIREPYATLIKDGIKTIETRSWKTNYRGKILIHACKTKQKIKEEIKPLIKSNLCYGKIICVADLVDCIFMDEQYIKKIKEENFNNYICGNYQIGRYGWVLKNIKILDNQFLVNGQLGLWNYNLEEYDED